MTKNEIGRREHAEKIVDMVSADFIWMAGS